MLRYTRLAGSAMRNDVAAMVKTVDPAAEATSHLRVLGGEAHAASSGVSVIRALRTSGPAKNRDVDRRLTT